MGMNGSLDITPGQRKQILALLSRYLPGVQVWAFGSRVKWSSRPDSDLDIVVFSPLEQKTNIIELKEAFSDCSLPFRVDLHVWQELPESFQENIKTEYVVLQEAIPTMKTSTMTGEFPILGALDAKIKVNRQLNRTLEEIARAIFKSWFIDFDPVRRNAAGFRNQSSEPFPDSFQDSELGQIPRGWDVGSIADFASLSSENLSKETGPGPIKYIDLSNVKWGSIETVKYYRQQDAPARAQRVLRPGDTVIGTVRPGNSYAFILTGGLTGSKDFAVLRPRRSIDAQFIYLGITAPANMVRFSHLAHGKAYPAVRPEVFAATKIIRPGDKILACFSMIIKPIFAKMAQNQHQSATLGEMRDAFLSRMSSGQ